MGSDWNLQAVADNKYVKREFKCALVGERVARIVQYSALLAIAFNRSQFSLFGKTVNLTKVKEWADWSRLAIYSHMFVHDVLAASKDLEWGDNDYATGRNQLIPVIDLLLLGLFLQENHYFGFDLGEKASVLGNTFGAAYIAFCALDGVDKFNTWQQANPDKPAKLDKKRREFAKTFVDSFLFMPASLLGFGGDKFLGAVGITTGILGIWNHYQNGWGEESKEKQV